MDLRLDPAVAAGYKSASQVARVVTERWAADNLYCLACSSDRLDPLRPNTRVTDYRCLGCSARYQLKSQQGAFGRTVSNSAYGPKMEAIGRGLAPHYAFLRYSREPWQVTDLFVVPGYFFTPAVIEKRPPLPETARRAGWVGSNILLAGLAPDARVDLISDGEIRPPHGSSRRVAEVRLPRDRPPRPGAGGAPTSSPAFAHYCRRSEGRSSPCGNSTVALRLSFRRDIRTTKTSRPRYGRRCRCSETAAC